MWFRRLPNYVWRGRRVYDQTNTLHSLSVFILRSNKNVVTKWMRRNWPLAAWLCTQKWEKKTHEITDCSGVVCRGHYTVTQTQILITDEAHRRFHCYYFYRFAMDARRRGQKEWNKIISSFDTREWFAVARWATIWSVQPSNEWCLSFFFSKCNSLQCHWLIG